MSDEFLDDEEEFPEDEPAIDSTPPKPSDDDIDDLLDEILE